MKNKKGSSFRVVIKVDKIQDSSFVSRSLGITANWKLHECDEEELI